QTRGAGASNQACLQRKAIVGAANDPLEHQADAAADAVLAGRPVPSLGKAAVGGGGHDPLQRKCAECEDEEARVQRKETTGSVHDSTAAADTAVAAVASGGRRLSSGERSYFEPRFGRDFSSVRVHENARTGEAARGIHARAYTLGNNIAFSAGQYAPGT